MQKLTCVVVCLSAAVLVSGCGHKRAAARMAAREAEMQKMQQQSPAGTIELSDSTLTMIRKAPVKTVYVDSEGRVVRFVPEKLVAAPGTSLPPENAPLSFLKVNSKGEVTEWKLAEVPGE